MFPCFFGKIEIEIGTRSELSHVPISISIFPKSVAIKYHLIVIVIMEQISSALILISEQLKHWPEKIALILNID